MSTTYPIYIKDVFGQDADALTTVPMDADPSGAVSFDQGYTPPYQYDLNTNPAALPISRGQFNYLLNVLSANLQQYQQKGLPEWIDPSQNGGVNFPYGVNAQVFYGTSIYRSLENSNTSVPGTDDKWLNISGSVDSVQVGMTIMWPAFGSPQGNYFLLDASQKSRTTYSDLFEVLCPILTGDINNGTNTITSLASTSDIGIGCPIEADDFPAGTVVIAIVSSTSIQVSNNATNTVTGENIRFLPWGAGDGSTTYNLPNSQGEYFAGAGGSGITWSGETYTGVGASLGDNDYQITASNLPNHTHTHASGAGFIMGGASGIGYGSSGNQFGQDSNTGGITGGTANTSIPQIPPTKLVKYFIKYQ